MRSQKHKTQEHDVALIGNCIASVLLGCCQRQLTSLSSMIVLQPPLLCEGWGGHPLCLSGDSFALVDLHCVCDDVTVVCIAFVCALVCYILIVGAMWKFPLLLCQHLVQTKHEFDLVFQAEQRTVRLQDGLEHAVWTQSDWLCCGQFTSGWCSVKQVATWLASKNTESVHVT